MSVTFLKQGQGKSVVYVGRDGIAYLFKGDKVWRAEKVYAFEMELDDQENW